MSAPVSERTGTAVRTTPVTIPAQRGAPPVAAPRRDGSQGAARKAYARRDERVRRLVDGRPACVAVSTGRAQFVLLVMVLLAVGLVATLGLSTAATADSYRLRDERTQAHALSEWSDRLHREVAAMDAAPELARRAGELGMVPVQDPARLVVAADGAVSLVGRPRVVSPPPAPVPPAPAPVPAEVAGQAQAADPSAAVDSSTTADPVVDGTDPQPAGLGMGEPAGQARAAPIDGRQTPEGTAPNTEGPGTG